MAVANFTGSDVPYDLTNITGTGNILEFIQNVNNLTEQTFMLGMLLAGFVILFVAMMSAGTKEALVASGFITTVMAILFFALEFIKGGMLTAIIIIYVLIYVISMSMRD